MTATLAFPDDPMSYEAALARQSDQDRPKRVRMRGQADFWGAIKAICTEDDPDPDDDPNGVRHGYEAEGLAATMAALDANGPLKPVPYFTATTPAPLPKRRRRTRISRAHLHVVLSEPYRLWVMNEGPRPTLAAEQLAA